MLLDEGALGLNSGLVSLAKRLTDVNLKERDGSWHIHDKQKRLVVMKQRYESKKRLHGFLMEKKTTRNENIYMYRSLFIWIWTACNCHQRALWYFPSLISIFASPSIFGIEMLVMMALPIFGIKRRMECLRGKASEGGRSLWSKGLQNHADWEWMTTRHDRTWHDMTEGRSKTHKRYKMRIPHYCIQMKTWPTREGEQSRRTEEIIIKEREREEGENVYKTKWGGGDIIGYIMQVEIITLPVPTSHLKNDPGKKGHSYRRETRERERPFFFFFFFFFLLMRVCKKL